MENNDFVKIVCQSLTANEVFALCDFVPVYLSSGCGRYHVAEWQAKDYHVMARWRAGQNAGQAVAFFNTMPADTCCRFLHWIMFRLPVVNEQRVLTHLCVVKGCLPQVQGIGVPRSGLSLIQRKCVLPSGIVTNAAVGEVKVSEHARLRFCQRVEGLGEAIEFMSVAALFERSFAEAERKTPPPELFKGSAGSNKYAPEIFLENAPHAIWFVVSRNFFYPVDRRMRGLKTVLQAPKIMQSV